MKSATLDYCCQSLVDYACRNWHYSGTIPAPIRCKVGVWEHSIFKGVVLFGYGATPEIGKPWNLPQKQVCELTRVALCEHETPVSRIIAVALKLLRQSCPEIRLVVSYADERHGHHGGIYQAGGWYYLGATEQHAYVVNGRIVHPRSLHRIYGRGGQSIPWLRDHVDPNAQRIASGRKHKYVYVLDDALRPMIEEQQRPYPKHRVQSIEGDAVRRGAVASQIQRTQGGSSPTWTLRPRKRIRYYDD